MKATVYHGPRDVRVETVPDPGIREAGDAIVRVVDAAICGSDLWFYRGISTNWSPGDRTGHEFTGVVEAVGSGVRGVKPGDYVAAPFSFSDGSCEFCEDGLQTSCLHGGFWGGSDQDGGQGEFVRVPFADGTLYPIPDAVRHDATKRTSALALTDVMSTGFHGALSAGARNARSVAVVGDGAVGLCAVLSARYLGAERIVAIGHHAGRLEIARRFGATDVIDSKDPDAEAKLLDLSGGGFHAVVEAVGNQDTLDLAVNIARPGQKVCFVGVPAGIEKPNMRRLFIANITLRGGVAPVRAYLPELMAALADGKIDPSPVFTSTFGLDGAPEGYEAMDARRTIKVRLGISAA